MLSLNAGGSRILMGHASRMARCASVVVLLLAIAGAAAPAGAVINDKVKKACKDDYKKLCPGYKVGSSQLRACMEAKQNDISWSCIQALMDAGEVDKERVAKARR